MENLIVINIAWEKIPFNINEVSKQVDCNDYGVYQIYGHHAAYGDETLLYIGKAQEQTFATRLTQEFWSFVESSIRPTHIRLGRICKSNKTEENLGWDVKRWRELIGIAERILIKSHPPAINKQENSGMFISEFDMENFLIINSEDYGRLLPEISTLRISYRYWNYDTPLSDHEMTTEVKITDTGSSMNPQQTD